MSEENFVDELRVQVIYDMIMSMTLNQQRLLLARLSDEGPDIGVREPREPSPESPGDEIALEFG